MLEYLNDIDTTALLAINGWNGTFQDFLWWMVSAKWASLLMALALLWVLLHQNRRHALLVLAMVVLAFVVADQLSSGVIKHLVERLRPTREPALNNLLHIVNDYRGGMYGFVSSHAANSFAAATLLALVIRYRVVTLSLFSWAVLQCYSRVYLGVHYPGDILGGIVVGVLVGWLVWRLMRWIERRWRLPKGYYTRTDAMVMASSFAVTVIALLTAALIQTV
ncbi:MAG: phosphatase PAP2 family protein [Muribaculaceae bacterium]|nr:phosphatase PAP2 family protein [Muribaculaceae bacterium]